jgi:predicted tellurium resistance membrane protein TerC
MDWLMDYNNLAALLTLTLLEIILGIDNIVVISILANTLPRQLRDKARTIGIGLALITRILLLLSLSWLAGLTWSLFHVGKMGISVRDIILMAGGLFLLAKGTHEIHRALEEKGEEMTVRKGATFFMVIVQIIAFDLVFSLDSVITAIGMAQSIGIMVTAIVIAIVIMLLGSGIISTFIHRHPSIKMLALSFLLMIGMTLVGEGLEFHIPKGYLYFAMGFSMLVETLNLLAGHRKEPGSSAPSGG